MNMRKFVSFTMKNRRQTCYLAVTVLSFLIAFGAQDVLAETYEYDDLNRVVKVIYEDESYTTYEYDASGNITKESFHEKPKTPPSGTGGGGTTGGGTGGSTTGGNATGGSAGSGNTGNTGNSTQSQQSQKKPSKPKHKNGMKAKSGNATYKITSVKKKTATFCKFTNKKKTSYSVPNYVKIDGIKYKVTKIDAKAFKNNKKIKKITINKYVTSIGKQAFYGCKKLKTITIKTTKLKSVGKQALKGIYKKATIKVPKKKYKTYQKLLKGKGQKKTVKIKKM